MDHGGHGGHGGGAGSSGPMEPMCSMSMLFTWDTTNLCIVFRSWHVYTNLQLAVSLLAIVALTAGYEALREASRRYETSGAHSLDLGHDATLANSFLESSSLLGSGRGSNGAGRRSKLIKGILYALQVSYSLFIMLLFMTYNGWVMLAVGVGAFVGYMAFGSEETSVSKTAACH